MKTIKTDTYTIEIKDIKYKINIIHPLLELKREELMDNIKLKFMVLLYKYIGAEYLQKRNISMRKRSDDILSHFIMNSLAKDNIVDPLIPYDIKSYSSLEKELATEINKIREFSDKDKEECLKNILKHSKLKELFNEAFEKLECFYKSDQFMNNKNNVNITLLSFGNGIILYYNNNPIFINNKLYKKVINRFPKNFEYNKDMYIWCLCKRYSILSSFNNQLAVHPNTMKDLSKKFNINFELFGSVFNTFNTSYCSLFYDIEKYFGSMGSFFDINILSGGFSVNPPFDYHIIKDTIDICNNCLSKKPNIIFIIWIPIWDNYGINEFVIKKCMNTSITEYDDQYKKRHKTEKQKTQPVYEGLDIIKNTTYYKHIRYICSSDMTYVNYMNYKNKYVANTYMIGLSNVSFDYNIIDNIKVTHNNILTNKN